MTEIPATRESASSNWRSDWALPSRVVAFVDDLERLRLVERVRDEAGRRRNALS